MVGLEQEIIMIARLLIVSVLSTVVGIDREARDKNAGLRTHILVGVGACLFTSLSIVGFPESETARVAANVVTGVGFLGAGVIYKGEKEVHDLTTAASIWTVAAIGMAVGSGYYLTATAVTILVWFILRVLWHFRNKVSDDKESS